MSRTRQFRTLTTEQEPFLTARSLATTYGKGHVIELHAHDWHQLLYACTGAMTVSAGQSTWMIPPGKAVVIPARCRHSIRMWGDVAMRSIYFPDTQPTSFPIADCRVISVTPLLREVILRVVELSGLDSRSPTDAHLMALLLDEIDAPPVAPLELLMPEDRRALAVADHILADPAADVALRALSRRYGAGSRTLERLFRAETGLSFGLWRQKARLLESIRVLAEGGAVTDAALDSGYGSVSAFIVAFKQTFGCTPGKLLAAAEQEATSFADPLSRHQGYRIRQNSRQRENCGVSTFGRGMGIKRSALPCHAIALYRSFSSYPGLPGSCSKSCGSTVAACYSEAMCELRRSSSRASWGGSRSVTHWLGGTPGRSDPH